MNYFEILGIPVGYKIDENAMLRSYLQKQAFVHPDINGEDSAESALLNEAYRTLRDPLERAQYILEIQGKYEDKLDPAFTIEGFALREKYEALSKKKEQEEFHRELSVRMAELFKILEVSEDNLEYFQRIYSRLRFMNSFLENIHS
ncbi:MAG: Fe-S protein assembly co-chaperone HscB [Holosporaceae bacterium]|jgi:molecular chaperone HscB|nr:Fe-S protein assembly co-chaperone HscB [Holosporaceae bacterium]